jgi:hypothetical protein
VIAPVALTLRRFGLGFGALIRRQGFSDIIGFLEPATVIATSVALVISSIDEFASWHDFSPSGDLNAQRFMAFRYAIDQPWLSRNILAASGSCALLRCSYSFEHGGHEVTTAAIAGYLQHGSQAPPCLIPHPGGELQPAQRPPTIRIGGRDQRHTAVKRHGARRIS